MYYSDGAQAGLTLSPSVAQTLKDRIHECVVCGQEPAPTGKEQRRRFAEWAQLRVRLATISDEEDARRREALHIPLDGCAACLSQLHAVIAVPTNLLIPLADRLRSAGNTALLHLLETRFAFVICEGCASEGVELERVSAPELEQRYDRTQMLLVGTNRRTPQAQRLITALMVELREVIRLVRGVA